MPSNNANLERLLNEVEAANLLNLNVRTLQAWRCRGGGPKYRKLGRTVRYSPVDIEHWLAEKTRSHTSESA
jgi:predicted DNA-binding transcriptional regulator AlpA